MIDSGPGEERERASATRRQVLAAGVAMLGLPALAAVGLAPTNARLRLGFAEFAEGAALASEPAARAAARAGIAIDPVPLASYGSIADHLSVGAEEGGVDAGIVALRDAERLPGGSEFILLCPHFGARPWMLVAREGLPADRHRRIRMAVPSPAHFEAARRGWPAPATQVMVLPPAQITPNLRAGTIDFAVLLEAAARPLLEHGAARLVARLPEPELEPALVLRKHWAAAHPRAAFALEALAPARLES
jgi:ABC-type nitrate/sulfonate/bicarbonate transport system substrate-binding protein